MADPPTSYHSRNRIVQSIDTTASSIVDSTISFDTVAPRLSDFPRPPLSIPSSPASTSGFPAYLRERLTSQTSSNTSCAPLLVTPPRLEPQRIHNVASSSNNGAGNEQLHYRPSILDSTHPVQYPSRPLSMNTTTSLSPFDWHKGSSTIDAIDATEERLLSTSFITSLLSSQHSSPHSTHFPASPSDDGVDGRSDISEATYPSISSLHFYPPTDTAPSNSVHSGPAHWEKRSLSRGSRHTPDGSGTSHSYVEHNQPTVVRVASMSQMGIRGASVIGLAPAFRMVSPSGSSTPSEQPSVWSSAPLLQGFGANETILEDSVGEQKVDHDVLPNKRPTTAPNTPVSAYRRRQSTQSSKTSKTNPSFVSAMLSRFSRPQKVKPLPPVPAISNLHKFQEPEYRKHEAALPHLVEIRVNTLSRILDRGHRQHSSTAVPPWDAPLRRELTPEGTKFSEHNQQSSLRKYKSPNKFKCSSASIWPWSQNGKSRRFISVDDEAERQGGSTGSWVTKLLRLSRFGKVRVFLAIALVIIFIIVAVVVGTVVGHKPHSSLPNCPENTTGNACDLDSTCACPSPSPGICVAQSLVTLMPTVNQLFNANLSTHDVATALWNTQGTPLNGNCAHQAMLVDVGSALSSALYPNRTAWARSALLWQLVRTMNLESVAKVRSFVNRADFSTLSQDGPVADPLSKFNITSVGFKFDFAAQTVTEPAVSWEVVGEPSSAQISEVDSVASGALDRMYSFAVASSIQQHEALSNYWRFSLQQHPDDLNTFMSIVSGAPIMIPFDATITHGPYSIEALWMNATEQFPPPISCYPSLDPLQLDRINQLENGVFGLSPASAQSQFDTSCYRDRPIYGILDVLRLRLPFIDSRSNVSKQGVLLHRAVSPRAVVYSGEILSALPHGPSNTTLTLNPQQYGTLNNFNHVMLQYLSSIPDVNIAISFVQFVLSGSAFPPTNASTLFNSLSSVPALEVAVFGNVTVPDITSMVSSFSTPSEDLWFGSDASAALRNWVITNVHSSIAWTDSATAPEVVVDSSLDDSLFNSVWDPAFQWMHTSNSGLIVNVGNITGSFQSIGKYSP